MSGPERVRRRTATPMANPLVTVIGAGNVGATTAQRVIEQGMKQGVFRDLPLELTAEIFLSSVAGMIDHMARRGEFRRPEQIVPTFMDILLKGLKR